MNGISIAIIMYLSFSVLIFAWISYKKIIPVFALLLLFLSSVFPILTLLFGNLFLDKGQHFSFTNAGPAGDWIAGSSVPFLTLATFWIAYEAFKSQREQIVIAKNDSKEARRLPLIPFLHLEILESSVSFLREDVHVIYFKTDPNIDRITFKNSFVMRNYGYESIYIRLTNIGLGLATQLTFDKFGEFTDKVSVNESDPSNLNSFFIQPNCNKEFLIYFPNKDEGNDFTKSLSLSFCDIIRNIYDQEYLFHLYTDSSIIIGEHKIRDFSISLISEGFPDIADL